MRILKHIIILMIIFLCLLIVVSCSPESGKSEKDTPPTQKNSSLNEKSESIIVALDNWPPWKISGNGEFGGTDVLILEEISRRLDINFSFVESSWARCIQMLDDGEVDMITSFVKTPERENYTYYLEPEYRIDEIVFYMHKDRPVTVNVYNDLYNFKVGTIKGAFYFDSFNDDQQIDKEELISDPQLLKMLASGRIDLMIGYKHSLDYFIALEGFAGQFDQVEYRVTLENPVYMAMSKKSDHIDLIPQLSRVLQEMVESGEIEEIIESFIQIELGER